MNLKEEEFIILASNVKSHDEINTNSRFLTKLARRKSFSKEDDWRVALIDISFKLSWYNVKNPRIITFIKKCGERLEFNDVELIIESGFYKTVNDLIGEINTQFSALREYVSKLPWLMYTERNKIISLIPGESYEKDNRGTKFLPILGEEIEKMLGLVDLNGDSLEYRLGLINESETKQEFTQKVLDIKKCFDEIEIFGEFPADITAGTNNLYVYTNIVRQSDVGDAFSPILTTIPVPYIGKRWGESYHFEPRNLVFRHLQTRNIDTIEIDIRDDSGMPVDFKVGNVVLKLKFQKHE